MLPRPGNTGWVSCCLLGCCWIFGPLGLALLHISNLDTSPSRRSYLLASKSSGLNPTPTSPSPLPIHSPPSPSPPTTTQPNHPPNKQPKRKGSRTYPENPHSAYNAQVLPRGHGFVRGLHVARRGTLFRCERAVAWGDAFGGGFGWHCLGGGGVLGGEEDGGRGREEGEGLGVEGWVGWWW